MKKTSKLGDVFEFVQEFVVAVMGVGLILSVEDFIERNSLNKLCQHEEAAKELASLASLASSRGVWRDALVLGSIIFMTFRFCHGNIMLLRAKRDELEVNGQEANYLSWFVIVVFQGMALSFAGMTGGRPMMAEAVMGVVLATDIGFLWRQQRKNKKANKRDRVKANMFYINLVSLAVIVVLTIVAGCDQSEGKVLYALYCPVGAAITIIIASVWDYRCNREFYFPSLTPNEAADGS